MGSTIDKQDSASFPPATRVLFVDDSPAIRQSALSALQDEGYSVKLACDGFEALACVVQWAPDIILADTMMPGLDGYQMCALLKSNTDYRGIPVIMLSGKNGLHDEERADFVGSDAQIAKPFTVQALRAALTATVNAETDDSR